MSLSERLVERIATSIAQDLRAAMPGHCLRVDHLLVEDAGSMCAALRAQTGGSGIEAFVLRSGSGNDGDLEISPERAIEIRNRKQSRLCLFVPADVVDAAASSLVNSFAVFDLPAALQAVTRSLQRDLPDDVRALASQLLVASKSSPEQRADYLGALLERPTPEAAGELMWRVGLIPDAGGTSLATRLTENRRCAQLLIRPTRAQTGAEERVDSLGLRPGGVQRELLAFLEGRRLRDARSWLPDLAQPANLGRITFDRWTFEETPDSDLELIQVLPLLDSGGTVEKWTKLDQPDGPNSQPTAVVGPKAKVVVKWTSSPKNPSNLHRWRAEVVLSRDMVGDDESGGAALPAVTVAAKQRKATIPLDLDLEGLPVHAVQLRVTALDDAGRELARTDGSALEGLSEEFWLVEEGRLDGDAPTRITQQTVSNLPLARLRIAAEPGTRDVSEAPGQWTERDLDMYTVTLNGRRAARVAMSPVLRAVEARCIGQPEEGGRYGAFAEAGEPLDPSGAQFISLGVNDLWEDEAGSTFLSRRKDLFRLLEKQQPRSLVEVSDWRGDLSVKARSYASAYQELLRSVRHSPAKLTAALGIDMLRISLSRGHGREDAVLVLPTHPLRVVWYAAYADLLRHWEHELCTADKDRAQLLDLSLVDRLEPVNCPAFALGEDGTAFLFAQNLRFFWGLALPIAVGDPARLAADVARVVGLDEREATLTDLSPERVAEEIRAYRAVHPYLHTLRVNVLNPGSGTFTADALRRVYTGPAEADDEPHEEQEQTALNVELIAHAQEPIPTELEPLSELQREVYAAMPRGRRHHLDPLFSIALRPITDAGRLPGGDVHVSLAIDTTRVTMEPAEVSDTDDSASAFGLLARFVSSFQESNGEWTWVHRISFPTGAAREKHPIHGAYTALLADTHREYLAAMQARQGLTDGASLPAAVVRLLPMDRLTAEALHASSDWVVTLDRFAGLEMYDETSKAGGSAVSGQRTYLLDYAPEFLEGIGHRMFVTTSHRSEVEQVLAEAMVELGFARVDESVGEVLSHLRTISGRLALRVLGDPNRAREAVGLGAVAAYLRHREELDDAILIPVDAHPEIFSPAARKRQTASPRLRCDLIRVQYRRPRLLATFIEVKARTGGVSDELLNQMVDQVEATETVFRDLFFRQQPPRLDHVLQRARLAGILRFYLHRARRYQFIRSPERADELESMTKRLESGITELKTDRLGFVVNLAGSPRELVETREMKIRFLSARDFEHVGFSTQHAGSPLAGV